jgi:hypothetical protein
MVVGELLCPTPVAEKLIEPGDTWMPAGAAPVPLSVTLAAVAIDAELTDSVPLAAPLAVGAKDTPTVQLAPAANGPTQVYCVQLKPWLAPIVRAGTAYVLVFVMVTVCAALVPPAATAPKLNVAGLTLSPDAVCAVPPKPTLIAATPGEDEEIFKVAALPPVVCGSKTTSSTQLAPAASVAPHVVDEIENTPVAEPVICQLNPASGAPPVFDTVTASGALAMPGCCDGNVRLA